MRLCALVAGRQLFITFLLFCSFSKILAQDTISYNTFQEFRQLYSTYTNDTTHINKLINKGDTAQSNDSAIVSLHEALRLSSTINYRMGIIGSLIGLCAYERNHDTSLHYGFQALSLIKKWHPNDSFAINIKNVLYDDIGQRYFSKAEYGVSAYYFYKILKNWQLYQSANEQLQMLDPYSKKMVSANLRVVFAAYFFLGQLWNKIGNPSRALLYYDMAQDIAIKYGDTSFMVHIWDSKADVYLNGDSANTEKSKYYSNKVLASKNANPLDKESAKLMLAIIAQKEGKNIAVLSFAQSILDDQKTAPNATIRTTTYFVLGRAYFDLKNYKAAEDCILIGLQGAQDVSEIDNIAEGHSILADIYDSSGQYKKALDHERIYALLRDSLIGQNKKTISDLEAGSQIANRDRELMEKKLIISQQETSLTRKDVWLAGISILTLLLGIIAVFVYKNFLQRQNALKQEQEIGKLKARMNGEEVERTRMARELHDGILSQLSAVKMNFDALPNQNPGLNNISDYQDAMVQLEDSIKELRITAHNLMPEILIQGGILEAVHIFCEKISKNGEVFIEFQTYGTLPFLEQNFELSLYRIIQELVHNIIKHAQANHGLVQISCKDGLLTVAVEDDGKGINSDKTGNGIGLTNLKERIKILNGLLDINTSLSGTAFYLEFDITKHTINYSHAYKTDNNG